MVTITLSLSSFLSLGNVNISGRLYMPLLPFKNSSYETLLFIQYHQTKGHLQKKIPAHFSLSLPQLTSSGMIFRLLNLPDPRDPIVHDFHRFAHCFLTVATLQLMWLITQKQCWTSSILRFKTLRSQNIQPISSISLKLKSA